jgi:hypothetical protein
LINFDESQLSDDFFLGLRLLWWLALLLPGLGVQIEGLSAGGLWVVVDEFAVERSPLEGDACSFLGVADLVGGIGVVWFDFD